jgi:hypothetical protein
MTPAEVAARFHAVPRGKGWVATCPTHEDSTPSLSIDPGNKGGVLVTCRAQCPKADVLAAVGLTMKDLQPAATGPAATIATVYDYRDERRVLLYQVVRYVPKDFKQRRPDGAGGFVWSIAGIRRVLYRLPELAGPRVWLTEGEKDADRLIREGFAATTFAGGGSAAWHTAYTDQLRVAGVSDVVLVPHHDPTGIKHTATVTAALRDTGIAVQVVSLAGLRPKGDVSDWLDAGHTRAELERLADPESCDCPICGLEACEGHPDAPSTRWAGTNPVSASVPRGNGAARCVRLTAASTIMPEPVRWLWEDRLALGTFALVGGREGIGKSICVMTLAADLTRGRLAGAYIGSPKSVILAATEDSWSHTIVPRLMAADADLTRIYRVDVITQQILQGELSLPTDLPDLEAAIPAHDVALVVLDPLMSRLKANLDSHKDAEVRQALEPLVSLAHRTSTTVLGLIHVNKSGSQDALSALMGSRAFVAVARAVLFVMLDPEHEHTRLLGQAKNNLGRMDLPTKSFTIRGENVAVRGDPIWTGALTWTADVNRSIRDVMQEAAETSGSGSRTATSDAAEWLEDYLRAANGVADALLIKRAGAQAGHSKNTLYRAKSRLGLLSQSSGFPRRAFWSLPGADVPELQ